MEKDVKATKEVMKGPIYKGSYRYIERKKKEYILKTLLYVGIGVFIYIIGLCLNKFQSNNIFTILAILMVLPTAKALVAVAVFWPFQSVSYDRIHQIYSILASNFPDIAPIDTVMRQPDAIEGKLNVYFDMVYTSSEKVMNLDALVVTGSRMIGLTGREKPKLTYLQSHMQDSMVKRGLSLGVKIYDKEDSFLKALKELKSDNSNSDSNKKDRDAAIEYIEAIIVK